MIIKSNFIFTTAADRLSVLKDSYIHIKEGKVENFYQEIPDALKNEDITDYSNCIIIPGFNDLHTHAPQYINRGAGLDEELIPWLDKYTFPAEARFNDVAFADKAYRLFLNRLSACGTLRFAAFGTLHSESTWHLMELTEESGLKAYIGKVNMDRNSPDFLTENTEKSLYETEELIVRTQKLKNVDYIITPRFVPSTTPEMMTGLSKLAEKYDLPIQSHLSENRNEINWVRELHPDIDTYTEVYDNFGLLRNNRTIMAHCIHLNDHEKDILADKGVYLAHCAMSNVNLSSGIMRLRNNLNKGLNCVIASDVAGGHTPAMNRQIALTIEISKINSMEHPKEKPLSISEALFLATKKSGSFFGKVGSFEPGYDFDALVVDMNEIPGCTVTPEDMLSRFIYDGDDRNIIARYVCGRKLKKSLEISDDIS